MANPRENTSRLAELSVLGVEITEAFPLLSSILVQIFLSHRVRRVHIGAQQQPNKTLSLTEATEITVRVLLFSGVREHAGEKEALLLL